MEKKTTVHPIFLTLEQLELVRQLVKPSIEYDDDGDMNIWAEDENAMNAAQIYRQTEIANKIELQLAWLTVYVSMVAKRKVAGATTTGTCARRSRSITLKV